MTKLVSDDSSDDSLDKPDMNDLFEVLLDKHSTFFKAQKLFDRAYHEIKGRNSNFSAPIMLRHRNISQDWGALIEQIKYVNRHYELNEFDSAELLIIFRRLSFKNVHDDQKILIIYNAVEQICQFINGVPPCRKIYFRNYVNEQFFRNNY